MYFKFVLDVVGDAPELVGFIHFEVFVNVVAALFSFVVFLVLAKLLLIGRGLYTWIFAEGKVVAELTGSELTPEKIVQLSYLGTRKGGGIKRGFVWREFIFDRACPTFGE